jgi:hypothetical protein
VIGSSLCEAATSGCSPASFTVVTAAESSLGVSVSASVCFFASSSHPDAPGGLLPFRSFRCANEPPLGEAKLPTSSDLLGEFPDLSDDTLILSKWIEAAQKRTLERTRRPIIAADIARFGEDETVIMRREGGWIRVYRAHHTADTMVTAGHIAKAMRDIDDEAGKNDWVRAIVDVPGVGGGVVDRLAELDLPVVPYNGGEAPIDKERFVNARAEDNWTLRERFEQSEIDIDPDDDKLAAQLGSIKWGIDSRGRIKIESKDDMRKRGLPSPDRADTAAMIFSGRANAAPINVESHAGESITGDLMTKAW